MRNDDKPIGYFTTILALDCETSGINYKELREPHKGYQAVSWGIIILNAQTFKELDRLYIEIKWNGESEWSKDAEKVHGLSKEYLEENGVSEEEALIQIASLIEKYWPMNLKINTLGHNQVSFDIPFIQQLFNKFDLQLNFGNRHIDTFPLFNVLLDQFNSEDGFMALGLKERKLHNAMEDIEMTVEAARRCKLLWKAKVGI